MVCRRRCAKPHGQGFGTRFAALPFPTRMNGNTGEYTFSHYLGKRAIMFRSGFEISIQRHRDLQDNRLAALVCILYTKCHRVSPGVQALSPFLPRRSRKRRSTDAPAPQESATRGEVSYLYHSPQARWEVGQGQIRCRSLKWFGSRRAARSSFARRLGVFYLRGGSG